MLVVLLITGCQAKTPSTPPNPKASSVSASSGADTASFRRLIKKRRLGEARRMISSFVGDTHAALECELLVAEGQLAATRTCLRALEGSPDQAHLIVATSRALIRAKRGQEAERLLVEARKTDPLGEVLLRAHYDFLRGKRWLRQSVAILEASIVRGVPYPWVSTELARGLLEKGRGDLFSKRHQEALVTFQRLLVLDVDQGESRFYLARALDGLGRSVEATKERTQATAEGFTEPPDVRDMK